MSVAVRPAATQAGVVAVAAVLAQEVAEVPDRRQVIVGHGECRDAGGQMATVDRQRCGGELQQLTGTGDAIGLLADQSAQLRHCTVSSRCSDRVGIGAGPGQLHHRYDDGGAEHAERSGDHLTGDLAEQAPTTRKVGRTIRQRHAVGITGAGVEAERDVVGVAFGREVHLPDHRFEHRAEAAGEMGRRRDLHGLPPYAAIRQHYGLDA